MKVYRVGKVKKCEWDFYKIRDLLGHGFFCYVWFDLKKALEWRDIMLGKAKEGYDLTIYEMYVERVFKVVEISETIFKRKKGSLDWEIVDVHLRNGLVDYKQELRKKVRTNGKYRIEEVMEWWGEGIVLLKDIKRIKILRK